MSVGFEQPWIIDCDLHFDDSRAGDEFALRPRPLVETLEEMVSCLLAENRISSRVEGR